MHPAFFSEIELFPSAVLAERWPTVPNLGRFYHSVNEPHKICSKCREGKPHSAFYTEKRSKDKLSWACKECIRKFVKNRAYYKTESGRKRAAEYQKNNRANCRKNSKRWYLRHFFKRRANILQRNSRKKTPSIPFLGATANELWSLWKRQRGRCALSGRKLTRNNCELGHRIARAKGGSDKIENLYWLHRSVNQAQYDLSTYEFVALCKEVLDHHCLTGELEPQPLQATA